MTAKVGTFIAPCGFNSPLKIPIRWSAEQTNKKKPPNNTHIEQGEMS